MGGLFFGVSAAFPKIMVTGILGIIAVVGLLVVVLGSFSCGRSFIGVGILSAISVIPLLIVGSCFAMATQWR